MKRKPIFSGDDSASMWESINAICDCFDDGTVHGAIYHVGCKLQELESRLEKLLPGWDTQDPDTVKEREDGCGAHVLGQSLERHEARQIHRDLQTLIRKWDMENRMKTSPSFLP